MKIHILFRFVDGPWGGGNQFLKSLKKYFEQIGVYENNPEKAEVILFNSYPFGSEYLFKKVFSLLRRFKGKTVIHRVDGPVYYVRGNDLAVDRALFYFNDKFSHGTVFQSSWSRDKCRELGLKTNQFETVIMNAPDKNVFYPKNSSNTNIGNEKIKIVAMSWSANIRKGFSVYKYLDDNLDFNRYQMTFIGNCPIKVSNIIHIKPLNSTLLADRLRGHDLYITASKNDPCPNSLLEALHCKLPAIALNSGGHPELIGNGGITFEGESDVISAIEKVASNLESYRNNISVPDISHVAEQYHSFCKDVHKHKKDKRVTYLDYINLMMMCYKWKLRKTFGTKKVK
jgi:glycosyltransferase involved in cell wall biosynthesis